MLWRGGTKTCVSISFLLSTSYNRAGMDEEDVYQNKEHMRGSEDFSAIVGRTQVRLTPRQLKSPFNQAT